MFSFSYIGTPRLIEFVASATGGASVAIPATAAPGDIAVVFDVAGDGGSAPSSTVPVGWTTIANTLLAFDGGGAETQYTRQISTYRLLTGGETTYDGMNAGNEQKVLLLFRPNWSALSVTIGSLNEQGTTGVPTPQVVAASGQPIPLIVLGGAGSSSLNRDISSSPAFTATVLGSPTRVRAGYRIYADSPVNHTVSCAALSGSNLLQSFYLRVS